VRFLFSFFSISWFPKFDEISQNFSQNFSEFTPKKKIPQILENLIVAIARKFAPKNKLLKNT
jgi:hypothetical protein